MRIRTWSAALIALALVGSSCSENGIVAPTTAVPVGLALNSVSAPSIVISQIYGGGGNSGATLKNDFIELFNPTGQPVNIAGWSVQYASAAGTSWAATPLVSGTIPAGGYFLVKEAAGANGTVDLPTPNAIGSIAMSASDGKVAVVQNTTALVGACPTGFVDLVSYGSGNCVPPNATAAPALTATVADLRKENGCAYTGNPSMDFTKTSPSPRNAASPVQVCPGTLPLGPLDHIVVAGPTTVTVGSTIQLAGTPQDVNNQTVSSATVTWASSDPAIATVDATGKVTGVAPSPNTVGITATAVDNGIPQKSATVQITVVQAQINFIDVSSSSASFPPGFQTQIFTTARVSSGGTVIPTTFVFEAVDPQIATIATVQNTGIVTGVAAPADGTTKPGFRITATPVGGGTPYSFVTHAITIEPPVSAPTSIYAKNDEFGDPTPADASSPNDLLIARSQYTISYNESRGTPNWVSYELDSRQMVAGQDRCNCFTADQVLPSNKQILTSDYTNGGYDRGHMARSFDRTAANVDNAKTFYLTNIVPQMADLNQGVWAQFENALGDSATKGGRAVYIITGPLYSRSHGLTYLKNEGKVAIPDSTWKVALIGPRNGGVPFTHGSIQEWNDVAGVTVLAVNMPNVAGVRNDLWAKYLTTVDKIERATGYDFLSLLPVAFQDALEAGDHAPVALFGVSGMLNEGAPITFDASSSTDPDLGSTDLGRAEALTYKWSFSDGDQTSGKVVAKAFANNGTYTATLVVSDAFGWEVTTSHTVAVANVAPAIGGFAGATLIRGETYTATGSFSDPGADQWTGTVNFGDGPATPSIDLTDKSFTLAHTYASAGTFSVVVSVNDGEVTSTRRATVVVKSTAQGIDDLEAALSALSLDNGEVNSLQAKLQTAAKQLAKDNPTPAENILGAFINEMQAMMQSDRVSPAAGSPIVTYAQRVIASITAP